MYFVSQPTHILDILSLVSIGLAFAAVLATLVSFYGRSRSRRPPDSSVSSEETLLGSEGKTLLELLQQRKYKTTDHQRHDHRDSNYGEVP
jgi:hypothetical protein